MAEPSKLTTVACSFDLDTEENLNLLGRVHKTKRNHQTEKVKFWEIITLWFKNIAP